MRCFRWKERFILGNCSIPIRLGRNRTKNLLILVNSFAVVWLVYSAIRGIFLEFMPALILGVVSGYFAIWWFFSGKCKRLTASLLLDGEWLPIIIAIILSKIFSINLKLFRITRPRRESRKENRPWLNLPFPCLNSVQPIVIFKRAINCLLYTSDAADE